MNSDSLHLQDFHPLREKLKPHSFGDRDVLVFFGELFPSGYANGILQEAKRAGMQIIYGTVGRRDGERQHLLRPLNEEEGREMPQPFINCPLEAGFDLYGEDNICQQLSQVRMSQWQEPKLDWDQVEKKAQAAEKDFCQRTQQFMQELERGPLEALRPGSRVVFVHLMAGGIPRAKILYPLMNRVFKGLGARHLSSKEFWESPLGSLCKKSFEAVTANTFRHLIELSGELREKVESKGGKVSYLAYGYHGTEIFAGGKYQWQSYSPYVQGWAKLQLEKIARQYWQKGIRATVFNCPEILTRSSSVFSGLEVSLYPLLFALEQSSSSQRAEVGRYLKEARENLKEGRHLSEMEELTSHYHAHSCIREHCHQFEKWPQHNHPEQMNLMIETSKKLCEMQRKKDEVPSQTNQNHLNSLLSQLVLQASGQIMLNRAWEMVRPVEWIGHDAVVKSVEVCP